PVYGAAVADTINAIDPSLSVEPRNTKGSTENVPLLEAGQLDLALVQGEVAHEALTGVGRPPAKLAILFAMYSTPGMFVVRADSPYRAIADLRGKPVAFGARGSGLVILARYVLDVLGLDQERDFHAVYLDRAGDGPSMVLDGRVAALWRGACRTRARPRPPTPSAPPRASSSSIRACGASCARSGSSADVSHGFGGTRSGPYGLTGWKGAVAMRPIWWTGSGGATRGP